MTIAGPSLMYMFRGLLHTRLRATKVVYSVRAATYFFKTVVDCIMKLYTLSYICQYCSHCLYSLPTFSDVEECPKIAIIALSCQTNVLVVYVHLPPVHQQKSLSLFEKKCYFKKSSCFLV